MMRALGAEVVLVDQLPGATPGQVSGADLDLVEAETQRIVRERGAFRPDNSACGATTWRIATRPAPSWWRRPAAPSTRSAIWPGPAEPWAERRLG